MEQIYQNQTAHSSSGSSSSSSKEETYSYTTVSSSAPKRRAGRTKFQETRHPLYKGVRRRGRDGQRWVCELRDPSNNKSRLWLGTFPTADMAARAHDVAELAFRGRAATLNFADSAWLLPILPVSLGRAAIQRAASDAARAFRYPSFEAEATSLVASDTPSDSSKSSTAKDNGLGMIENLNDPFDMVEYVGMQGGAFRYPSFVAEATSLAAPDTPSDSSKSSTAKDNGLGMTENMNDPFDMVEYVGMQAGYYDSMAEALLIDLPPPAAIVFEEECEADFSLWSFS